MWFKMTDAIITSANPSQKKPDTVYLEVHDDGGSYNVSTVGIPLSKILPILRRPIVLEGTMEGAVFNRSQILRITTLDVKAQPTQQPVPAKQQA